MQGVKQPFASIIMPAYNVAPWVGRAIDSCLEQSRPDWQLIIVDDGSTDTTVDVVNGFDDDRIELIRTSGGYGPGGARNLGLDRATGNYLVPLDADDALHPDRLQVLSRCAAQHDGDTILFDRSIRSTEDPFTVLESIAPPAQGEVSTERFVVGSPPCKPLIPAALVKRTRARYPTGVIAAEDYAFIVLLLDGGARLVEVRASLYWHRLRPGSLTRSSAVAIHAAQSAVLAELRQECTNEQVRNSLEQRQVRIDHLYAVGQIVEDLRDRHVGLAMANLRRRPRLIIPTIKRLSGVLRSRIGLARQCGIAP